MLQTRALYNLLRFDARENSQANHEAWCIEDLREISSEEIQARLKECGIVLEREIFFSHAAECGSPEGLWELFLKGDESPKEQDRIYLLIFELWRRWCPEKQSVSIFCDELDYRIDLYDRGKIERDEMIQDALSNLQEVLDENSDTGADPIDVFEGISEYCAHDLESFLYDVITKLLDAGNLLYAQELIDGFFPYMAKPSWFEFLKARLCSFTDMQEANRLVESLLGQELESSLLFEILRFLTGNGNRSLFVLAIKKMSFLLETQGEFLEVLAIVSEYYRRLDQDHLEQSIQKLMQRERAATALLDKKDPDFQTFYKIATGWNRI